MSRHFIDAIRNFIARLNYIAARFGRFSKNNLELSARNWRWINRGSLLAFFIFLIGYLLFLSGDVTPGWMLIAGLLFVSIPLLYGALIKIGMLVATRVLKHAGWMFFATAVLIFFHFSFSLKATLVLIFYLLFTVFFISGALSNLTGKHWEDFTRFKKLVNIFFLTIGLCNLLIAIIFLAYPGANRADNKDFSHRATWAPEPLELDDPSIRGNFRVDMLTYGAASDRHRIEFAEEADMHSRKVDGSGFIDGWDKLAGRLRTLYWGFGPDSLPLNGRIWMPEKTGSCPVVLMVHGNHFDRDFSDAGYGYLGNHIASHGYIAVSIDQNFLNGGMTNFGHTLSEENDARGWLLLKHLELFREWTQDSSSLLYGKADLDHVVLIGHSRGGEAVNIAACFNRLGYYPENAEEKFDFDFGIRGIVAIAQVDGQYKPANRPTPVKNVNYLALQGSMDADLESYAGLSQFNRIIFDDSLYHFKAGLYIENANHGQFNTSWGINDVGYPDGLLLNRRRLLPPEDQEQIALVYITSFIKVTFGHVPGYLPLFSDYRQGYKWLPSTRYLNQFMDNRSIILADYEEDIDLTTGSLLGTEIRFAGLADLYEQDVWLRKEQSGSNAVFIGWNNEGYEIPGSYTIQLPAGTDLPDSLISLKFDVTLLDDDPGSRIDREENQYENGKVNHADKETWNSAEPEYEIADENEFDHTEPSGFSILLKDLYGNTAAVSTLEHFPLSLPFVPELYKLKIFGNEDEAEPIPQYIEISLEHFKRKNPSLDTDRIRAVQFVFDQRETGMISLDNIGFTVPGQPDL